jgi:hypothetical protein
MTAKLTDRARRELSSAAPPADVVADIVFSRLLTREAELLADVEIGLPGQDELDVVRALLRLIFSPAPKKTTPVGTRSIDKAREWGAFGEVTSFYRSRVRERPGSGSGD